jgi:hypothetical protein
VPEDCDDEEEAGEIAAVEKQAVCGSRFVCMYSTPQNWSHVIEISSSHMLSLMTRGADTRRSLVTRVKKILSATVVT